MTGRIRRLPRSSLAGLLVVLAGCWGGARTDVPVLTIPEAPPRVVAQFPPDPEPLDPAVVEREPGDGGGHPSGFMPVPPPSPPPPSTAVASRGEPEPTDEPVPEEVQLRRQLITVPDEAIDQDGVGLELDEAERMLENVRRSSLDSAGRAQYDTATRFLEQARAALATENLVFAHYLGQKARTIAAGL